MGRSLRIWLLATLNEKFYLGLMALGFGVSLLTVFPAKAVSQTIPYKETEYIQANYEDIRQAYLNWKAQQLKGKHGGACVVFVRDFLSADRATVPSLAKALQTNAAQPEIGSIVKTKESFWGHVAIVIDISETTITILESNVPLGSERIGTRTLLLNDKRILGYKILSLN